MDLKLFDNNPGPGGDYPVNLHVSPQSVAGIGALRSTPGSEVAYQAGSGACRGLLVHDQSVMYAVIGNTVYEILAGGSPSSIGTLSTSSGNVWLANGNAHCFLVDTDGQAYYWTTPGGTLTTVSDLTGTGVTGAAYQDGFFVTMELASDNLRTCELNDPSDWNVDYYTPVLHGKSGTNKQILSSASRVHLFMDTGIHSFHNPGKSGFPFYYIAGSSHELGVASGHAVSHVNGEMIMVSSDRRLMRFSGGPPVPIQHAELYRQMSGYSTVSDVVAFGFSWAGHAWHVFRFPTEGVTWVYDSSVDWLFKWNTGEIGTQHYATCAATWNGYVFLGADSGGKIMRLDKSLFRDETDPVRWKMVKQGVYNEGKKVYYHSLELFMRNGQGANIDYSETAVKSNAASGASTITVVSNSGVYEGYSISIVQDDGSSLDGLVSGVSGTDTIEFNPALTDDAAAGNKVSTWDGRGEDPAVSLRCSDDFGRTWKDEITIRPGSAGDYDKRAVWRAIGAADRRVFEITCSDPAETELYSLHALVVPGVV